MDLHFTPATRRSTPAPYDLVSADGEFVALVTSREEAVVVALAMGRTVQSVLPTGMIVLSGEVAA